MLLRIPLNTPSGVTMFNPVEHHCRHLNSLTDKYMHSYHRAKHSWQGQVEKRSWAPSQALDSDSFLCEGNRNVTGDQNPDYQDTFVLTNDLAPLLLPKAHIPSIWDLSPVQQQVQISWWCLRRLLVTATTCSSATSSISWVGTACRRTRIAPMPSSCMHLHSPFCAPPQCATSWWVSRCRQRRPSEAWLRSKPQNGCGSLPH